MTARPFLMRNFGSVNPLSLGKPAARFPGAIATDSDLAIAVDRQQTTLAQSLDSVSTTMTVASGSIVTAYNLLSIDAEIVKVTSAPAGNVISIQRGFDGSVPAAHSAGATVSGYVDAWHHNALVAEIEAIESALGPNLSSIPGASPYQMSSAHNFAPQSPGGSLGVGTNQITISPVPQGLNGSDAKHYLLISGGTGAQEAVLITGGSAVAGAPSGTLFITCANTHSGAWTIGSATAGIQEACIHAVAAAATAGVVWVSGSVTVYAKISVPAGITITGAG
ncbi:MAG TPA: hypothetical protein VHS97_22330, partial [Isosphaeraceae bacterium]|nr:hypothetical protein [Isosphaeraceae bacterium]